MALAIAPHTESVVARVFSVLLLLLAAGAPGAEAQSRIGDCGYDRLPVKVLRDRDARSDPEDPTHPMIVEIPDPQCAQGTEYGPLYQSARDSLRRVPRRGLVEVTGVRFFDFIHTQRGISRNRFELHPVASLRPVRGRVLHGKPPNDSRQLADVPSQTSSSNGISRPSSGRPANGAASSLCPCTRYTPPSRTERAVMESPSTEVISKTSTTDCSNAPASVCCTRSQQAGTCNRPGDARPADRRLVWRGGR